MSTSAIHSFGNQPSTPVQVLMSRLLPSATIATTGTPNTVVTTAQVRTPYTNDTSTGEVQFIIGSEKSIQPYTPYREVSLKHLALGILRMDLDKKYTKVWEKE